MPTQLLAARANGTQAFALIRVLHFGRHCAVLTSRRAAPHTICANGFHFVRSLLGAMPIAADLRAFGIRIAALELVSNPQEVKP